MINYKMHETITELTADHCIKIYAAQMRHAIPILTSASRNAPYGFTDSSNDEMQGTVDLLIMFHCLYNNDRETTIQRLRETIVHTCCDAVADLTMAMLFDDEDHYDEFIHITDRDNPYTRDFTPFTD